MAVLPWQNASGYWDSSYVGKTVIGPDGARYQTYPDPASPSGYTVKRSDDRGDSFQYVNAPTDGLDARQQAVEAAQADQNGFNRDISTGNLDVNRGTLDVSRQNAKTNKQNARTNQVQAQTGQFSAQTDRSYKEALVAQAKDELAFKYAQQAQTYQIQQAGVANDTLKLGASLRGPRDWDKYLETAASAGQNPQLQGALKTWSSLTNVHPNTGAVAGGNPQTYNLDSLYSDFTGSGVTSGQGGQGSGGYTAPRDANLDAVAMTPGKAGNPGWWQGLGTDEKERAKGYWESHGWSPDSVLNSLSYTSVNQGLGYGGA